MLPPRCASSPCPSPSPRLPPQVRGQWAGAGQALPSLRAASPSVPGGSSPHASAPAPVPLIHLTVCSSAEMLPSFSLTSDRRLGDTPPAGCALRASSAAPRFPAFPAGPICVASGFLKKHIASRPPILPEEVNQDLAADKVLRLFSFFFFFGLGHKCSSGWGSVLSDKGVELRVDTLQPFHGSRCCPGSSRLGLLGFEY